MDGKPKGERAVLQWWQPRGLQRKQAGIAQLTT